MKICCILYGGKMIGYLRNIRKEENDFKILYENISDEVLKNRIKSLGEWYIKYACVNKFKFYLVSFIGIIAPLIVTAFNTLNIVSVDVIKLVTVVCSLVASFSTSYLALTRCREKWKIYRDSIERLKRLLVLYWSDLTNDHSLKHLMNEIEKLKDSEYERWSNTYNTLLDISHKNSEASRGQDHTSGTDRASS